MTCSDLVDSALKHSPFNRLLLNCIVTVGSVFICLMLLPTRLPGMEIAGIGPNWLLIWVIAWSVKRTTFQGAIAGLILGVIQDCLTNPLPTHSLSLILVGIFTARLQKERYIREDFISIALITFGMAVIAETAMAIQYSFQGDRNLIEIWNQYQLIALSSALVSSLWAPIIYFPLNLWWKRVNELDQLQV